MIQYTDIFAFGDSYIAGSELAGDTILDFRKTIEDNFPNENVTWNPLGKLNQDKIKNMEKMYKFIIGEINYKLGGIVNTDRLNRELSFPNQLAKNLNIPAYNFGVPGASMIKIIDTIFSKLDQIKTCKHPMVIIGLTSPDRTARYTKHFMDIPGTIDNIRSTILNFDNPFLDTIERKKIKQYKLLDFEFGNDSLARAQIKVAQIYFVKTLLKDIPHIIIDNIGDILSDFKFNQWYLDYTDLSKNDIRLQQGTQISKIMRKSVYDKSLSAIAESIQYSNDKHQCCILGHIAHKYHKIFADIIYEDIKSGNINFE
jgi:hypothetical protein